MSVDGGSGKLGKQIPDISQTSQSPYCSVFSPPTPFNFRQPETWDKWIKRFERYSDVSGLNVRSGGNQTTTLIYCMGDEADDILSASSLTEEDKEDYGKVKDLFKEVFIGKRNTIYERARFNSAVQEEGESIDTYITRLHKLVEHCQYGSLRDEMVRDRIVIGILDKTLSESLQLQSNLTLETAIIKCRQIESVKKQQVALHNILHNKSAVEIDNNIVDRVVKRTTTHDNNVNRQTRNEAAKSTEFCWNCGRKRHSKLECPARNVRCNTCLKVGHFAKVCRGGNRPRLDLNDIHGMEPAPVERQPQGFLGQIQKRDDIDNYRVVLKMENSFVHFKIDSGADVTVIPPLRVPPCTTLLPANKILFSAGRNKLNVLGKFNTLLQYKDKSIKETMYVVDGLEEPLLGKPAINAFNFIKLNISSIDKEISFESIKSEYPELFHGLGSIPGEYKIDLNQEATPITLHSPRNVPLPLRDKVKVELERMVKLDVISPVEEPTDWCSPMVVVPKPNGDVRLCIDLTKLNKSVRRPNYILPDVEETLGQIGDSHLFSKLDANSGFWQIKLAPESAKLTTFITPFGRFFFKRLPFGISSASEYFQRRMVQLLDGLEGVLCQMDDVLVHGRNQSEHNARLYAVLNRLHESGMTLNSEKCEFSKTKIKFLGHIIENGRISPDPSRVEAIVKLSPPRNVSEVRQFLGMVNQVGKFIPNLAEKTKSIRDLLKKDHGFYWDSTHQSAFQHIIQSIKDMVYLTLYNPNYDTIVSADASSFGLGAVLLQMNPKGDTKPVAFASKSLSDTEQRYAQIEKEAYAITWACERFSKFLIGKKFHIETDHKPLLPLLSRTDLSGIPLRIQRFKMKLMRYDFTISHTAGKDLLTADMLSRSPVEGPSQESHLEVEAFVDSVWNSLPASEKRLQNILEEQQQSPECKLLYRLTKHGWPRYKDEVPDELKKWWTMRGEITIHNKLLCKGDRIIIPSPLQKDILSKIHDGHWGIRRCLDRAKMSVFWPGITDQIKQMLENCEECIKQSNTQKYHMVPTETPNRPWQKVAMDIMEWHKQQYLVVVDYYSKFIELAKLSNITTQELIQHSKSIFARHGIPEMVFSDSGVQFVRSREWTSFANEYGFSSSSSSPYYHQSNGEAERAVQTMKNMLEKCDDPYIGLLSYRSMPNCTGYSPAELLMGRILRTRLPTLSNCLIPRKVNVANYRRLDLALRQNQRSAYNRRHRTIEDKPLFKGQKVFIPDKNLFGTVLGQVAPHSYQIHTSQGVYRRNSTMLRGMNLPDETQTQNEENGTLKERDEDRAESDRAKENDPPTCLKKSRYGRCIRPPKRLDI